MTEIAGFLVGDFGPNGLSERPIGLQREIEDKVFVDNIPPFGAFLWTNSYPENDDAPQVREGFINQVSELYQGLLSLKLKDIRMATTLLTSAFEGYELREFDRKLSPIQFDDWIELCEIWSENVKKEQAGNRIGLISVASILSYNEK
jgi:hypothetical protein